MLPKQNFIQFQNGQSKSVIPKDKKFFRLKELQDYVKGYIQIIPIRGTDKSMVLNEEGKYDPSFIWNGVATDLMRKTESIFPDDFIVGDVLIINNKNLD